MWQVVLEVPRGGQAGTPGWLWHWLLSQGQPQCLTGRTGPGLSLLVSHETPSTATLISTSITNPHPHALAGVRLCRAEVGQAP